MLYVYIIIGIVLVGGIGFYLASRNKKSAGAGKQDSARHDSAKRAANPARGNMFDDLRSNALTITAGDLGFSFPADQTIVFGVVMDMGMQGATATLVAYQSGDASLYLSSGGGVIGAGQHQSVSQAAKQFVQQAQGFLDKATKTMSTSLPATGAACFYLLTNNGIYAGQDQISNMETGQAGWGPLFYGGNLLLTEIRLASNK